MKKLILLTLVVLSCNKPNSSLEKPLLFPNFWGEQTARREGGFWTANIFANRYTDGRKTMYIYSAVYNELWFRRESLDFGNIPIRIGKYNLSPNDTLPYGYYATHRADGDVAGAGYDIFDKDSISDYLEITEIDGDIIRGTFQASFVRSGAPPIPAPSDIRVFLDGKFITRFLED